MTTVLRFGISLTLLCASAGSLAASQLLDVGKLIGNFNTSIAGTEIVVQSGTLRDSDFDSVPDEFESQFNVYTLGSSTLRYSSQPQTFSFNFPIWMPSYCSLDDLSGDQPGSTLIRAGKRVVSIGGYQLQCSSASQLYRHGRVWVFGAAVDSAGGASWKYQASGFLDGASGYDSDGNGSIDQIVVRYSVNPTPGTTDTRVVVLRATTGVVVSTTSYPIVR